MPHIAEVGIDDEFLDSETNLRRDGRQHPKEYAANEFAADLLMPKMYVKEKGNLFISEFKKSME